MTDHPGHYRDELNAAHERINELERELALARGLDPSNPNSDALARMLEQRRALVKSLQPRQMNIGSLALGAQSVSGPAFTPSRHICPDRPGVTEVARDLLRIAP